ncbi:MAG: DUF4080 domain-containing protein [Mariprofundaceae bacterium]|nr:DUF4080 domain-containing protein [Mariprofundaceae bacterium]
MNHSTEILLTTLNARYAHASLGLRYLYANLDDLQSRAAIIEFVINDQIGDMVERLLQEKPVIIGFGVYIWNAVQTAVLIRFIRIVAPNTILVLGGPEVSHHPIRMDDSAANYIIQGEAELAFKNLCQRLLNGDRPKERVIQGEKSPLTALQPPYKFYTDDDIKNRCIYVEASRGCPFRCEFCLSSIDPLVRHGMLDVFFVEMETLWQRGVRSFKFIDRTFNINIKAANALLDFFLAKEPPYFLHFEVIPDHFPESLRQRVAAFPAAALQLEIGIQTLNPTVAATIQRKMNMAKMLDNISFLTSETKAHMHLDLIVGLPGETMESFAHGLNQLCAISSCEIQIGILKQLSGTQLHRHDEQYQMCYAAIAPYELLQNKQFSFFDMQKMKRFARFWNLYYNSGNFKQSVRLLWPDGCAFEHFYDYSQWLYAQTRSTWKIALERLAQLLFDYLNQHKKVNNSMLADTMIHDIMRLPGRKLPSFLRPYTKHTIPMSKLANDQTNIRNKRQRHHA